MSSPWKVRAEGTTRVPDLEQVRRSLPLLLDHGQGVNLRVSPSYRSVTCLGSDLERICATVKEMAPGSRGIYWSLHPVPPNLSRRMLTEDAQSLRYLMVDCDPVRKTDINATEAEHEAAREMAAEIVDHLSSKGWPAPFLMDSGNGWHLLYRLEQPNTRHVRSIMGRFLKALAGAFNTEVVEVDQQTHKATIAGKVPGTWVRKGPHSEERPYRMARLVHVPATVEPVPLDLIAEEAGVSVEPEQVERARYNAFRTRASGGRTLAYVQAALDREAARVALSPDRGRNNCLNKAAYNLGQLVGGEILERARAEQVLMENALARGIPEREARGTIRSGIEAGMKEPRGVPDDASRNGRHPASTRKQPKPGEAVIFRASTVTPRRVEWLWPGRIPLGKLTTFAGVGGLGKTFVLCDIAARVTLGLDWPDGDGVKGECCREPGQVLFISGEDDEDDTLVPRLIECGADLDRVVFLTTQARDSFTLHDLKTLDAAIEQTGTDVRFVAIDPPTAYLGGVDDHKNAELRSLLTPLKEWSKKHKVALVFNTHVNKPQGKVEAMMRVMGSVAWVNAVRAAHMFARDPEDPERRLFIGMKLNLGKEKKGLAYRIVETETLARIEWLGEVDTTADQAVNGSHQLPRKRNVIAAEWLEEVFDAEAEIPSKSLFRRKDAETTLSNDALREAKEDMGIRAQQKIDADGVRQWVWFWPSEAREQWQAAKRAREEKAEAAAGDEKEDLPF